jgi:hypothetical protein
MVMLTAGASVRFWQNVVCSSLLQYRSLTALLFRPSSDAAIQQQPRNLAWLCARWQACLISFVVVVIDVNPGFAAGGSSSAPVCLVGLVSYLGLSLPVSAFAV